MRGEPGFDERAEADWAPGTVRGIRYFSFSQLDSLAHSPVLIGAHGGRWHDGENTAACAYHPEHVPPHVENCGCGFWAYWTRDAADKAYTGGDSAVIGVVEGYGRTLLGDKGFRSAKARILGLACMFKPPEVKVGGSGAPPTLTARQRMLYDSTAGFSSAFHAMGGSHGAQPTVELAARALAQAAEAAEMRIIETEVALGGEYPSARIYTSASILLRVFPPTTDYIPKPDSERPSGTDLEAFATAAGITMTQWQKNLLASPWLTASGVVGSRGIAQPLPVIRPTPVSAATSSPAAQIRHMYDYIRNRYGS